MANPAWVRAVARELFVAGCDFMFSELVGQDSDHVHERALRMLHQMRALSMNP